MLNTNLTKYIMNTNDTNLIQLNLIKEEISKGDLFQAFDILNSSFDHTDFNEQGFYRLTISEREGLEDVMYLGKDISEIDSIYLTNENIGINYREELSGDELIQLKPLIDNDRISVRMHIDDEHWLYDDQLVFVNLNQYI
ncbi:hypothetical protein N9S65_01660 [Pseudomonadota bacterium]|nr:hypothetical protein [Pseudomonadota bacterium]